VTETYAPASVGRILDRAVALYRDYWRVLVPFSLIVILPAAALLSFGQSFSQREALSLISTLIDAVRGTSGAAPAIGPVDALRMQLVNTIAGLAAPVWLIVRLWVTACLLACAPAMVAGHPITWRELAKAGRERFLMLIVVSLVVGALSSIGFFLLVIPGVIATVGLFVAPTLVVVENAPIDRAITRGWALVWPRYFWRTLGFMLAMGLVVTALELAVAAPSAVRQVVATIQSPEALYRPLSIPWTVFEGTIQALALALVTPLPVLATYLYYTDLRSRSEGMDLVIRARAATPAPLGEPAPAASAPASSPSEPAPMSAPSAPTPEGARG
jgi:hypothetical protein